MEINTGILVSLTLGVVNFLLALARPNIGIALTLIVLYFPIFKNILIGPFEFSASTFLVVGLFLRSLDFKHSSTTFNLTRWQRRLLVVLGITFFFSLIFSYNPVYSLHLAPNLIIYWMIIFVMMKLVRSTDQLWSLARLIIVLGFILSLWRIELRPLRIILGLPSLGINGAVFAFHPAVALALITGVMLPVKAVSRRWRLFNWLVLISLLFHSILYQSRAGWLALIGMIIVIGFQARSRARTTLIVGIASLAGFALIVFSNTIEVNLEQTKITAQAAFGDAQYTSVTSDDLVRLIARDAGWRMFLERPVFGWGPNSYTILKSAFVTYQVKEANEPGAFNSWLIELVDFGVIGTGVVFVVFLLPLFQTWRGRWRNRNFSTILAFSFAVGVLGISIHLLFIDLLYSFSWAHAGLALAAARLALESVEKPA